MNTFLKRHQDLISGTLSCFDRVVITGTLPDICYSGAMAGYLSYHKIRIFDFTKWAEPLRETLRHHAKQLAEQAGLEIEFIRSYKSFRKEARIKSILEQRGDHPGLVHIFSAMESCTAYRPWHDKKSHKTFLKTMQGKCLHYYFYFIDEDFGLCYLRLPTWAPFRLQIYFNGHSWLARHLDRSGIAFKMLDNAFLSIEDPEKAQTLSDSLEAAQLHRRLDRWAAAYCPIASRFRNYYHWSFMQVEYATDVVFRQQSEFQPLYENIVRSAAVDVKADQVAAFLGRKLVGQYRDEIGNNFNTRIQGTRIRHTMGANSIKLYDKFGLIARVECTSNNVSSFKHRRKVEQRNRETVVRNAPLRKTIYSLKALRKLMNAANQRYLAYMASIEHPGSGQKACNKLSSPAKVKARSYRGFNLFLQQDFNVFVTLMRGEWAITGFRARDLREHLSQLTPSRASYLIKRLRTHGIIKKVGRCYKYYLTRFGRDVIATVMKLKQQLIVPSLCQFAA